MAGQRYFKDFALTLNDMSRGKKLEGKTVIILGGESSMFCIAWYGVKNDWKISNSKHVWVKKPNRLTHVCL